MPTTRTHRPSVLVLVAALLVGVVTSLAAATASSAAAGVIAPPQPGGLTGSIHFSCEGRQATPTATVVVHNSYANQFGVSVWKDATIVLGNLSVPGHSTRIESYSDPSWEDTTVFIDVLRIGSVVVAAGSHHFDCQAGSVVGTVGGSVALSTGATAIRHM